MGLLFLHLVPETFTIHSSAGVAGLFVLFGFIVQILLEYISMGLEHGHVHLDGHCTVHDHGRAFPIAAMISLCLHALLESMPLAEGYGRGGHVHMMGVEHVHIYRDMAIKSPLFFGLVLHKLPVGLVLMGLMKSTGTKALIRWLMLGFFGLMPLVGMYSYDFLMHNTVEVSDAGLFMAAVNGLVISILLQVSTTVLFEAGQGHRFNLKKLAATFVGLEIAYLTL